MKIKKHLPFICLITLVASILCIIMDMKYGSKHYGSTLQWVAAITFAVILIISLSFSDNNEKNK